MTWSPDGAVVFSRVKFPPAIACSAISYEIVETDLLNLVDSVTDRGNRTVITIKLGLIWSSFGQEFFTIKAILHYSPTERSSSRTTNNGR